MRLPVRVHIKSYDRVLPILNREVSIEGVEPTFMAFEIANFAKMLRSQEYDISEMSLSSYLIARDRGIPIIAIPVFPHRRFRHSFIFVRSNGDVAKPEDLIGKRVGIPVYQATALVWIRGILSEEYEVKPEHIKWFFDRKSEPLPLSLPPNISIQSTNGVSKETLFLEDKLDALFDADIPRIFAEGNPKIRRLFPDYRSVELDYYKRTGIFPIMHTIVLTEQLVRQHPWIPLSVWRAFVEAKRKSYNRMEDARLSNLVWPHVYWEEEKKIFGPDPFPYSIEKNRKALDKLISYSLQQGLIKKEPKLEHLFVESTLSLQED
jgi:4,5-dihydroxyphthalate decarboxylase